MYFLQCFSCCLLGQVGFQKETFTWLNKKKDIRINKKDFKSRNHVHWDWGALLFQYVPRCFPVFSTRLGAGYCQIHFPYFSRHSRREQEPPSNKRFSSQPLVLPRRQVGLGRMCSVCVNPVWRGQKFASRCHIWYSIRGVGWVFVVQCLQEEHAVLIPASGIQQQLLLNPN